MLSIAKYVLVASVSVSVLSGCINNFTKSKRVKADNVVVNTKSTFEQYIKSTQSAQPAPRRAAIVRTAGAAVMQDAIVNQSIVQYTKLTPQAKKCIQKYYVGYEYALCLYDNGDMNSAVNYLRDFNPNNQLAAELLQKIDQPLVYIVNKANRETNEWLNLKTELGDFAFHKPVTPVAVIRQPIITVSLNKKEFETTANFNQRVASARQEMADKEALVKRRYKEKLDTYNQLLSTYNIGIKKERQERELRSLDVYLGYINNNIAGVLGEPYFSDLIYDADKQQMFGTLFSDKSKFSRPVVINVSLEDAKAFKDSIAKVFPVLEFDVTRKSLSIANIGSELNGKVYPTQLLNSDKEAVLLRKAATSVDIISSR
jgi:hypothetical protein